MKDKLDNVLIGFLCILMISIIINIGLIMKEIRVSPKCEEVCINGSSQG